MSAGQTSMRELAWTVLKGEMPTRLPFITRLEAWYRSHTRTQTLPEDFDGLTLEEIHRITGIGQLKFVNAYAFCLRGVELHASFNGETFFREYEPIVENFPSLWDLVSTTKPGVTETRIITPLGSLTIRHALLEEHIQAGLDPYLQYHLINTTEDYDVVEYILEKMEFVPLFDKVESWHDQVGDHGLVVPLLQRIPFQQALLEYVGEIKLFQSLHYERQRIERLLDLLDEQMTEVIPHLAPLGSATPMGVPYVEFPDNLHGMMTSPRLFRAYCLPHYQRYTNLLHEQGKKVGSHTDGDMKTLLSLITETGLDVCESFSPQPLTTCGFQEAWQSWQNGPLIWGGIPSTWLEENLSQVDFERNVENLIGILDRPILLGIVDLFMKHNSIDRATHIAQYLTNHFKANMTETNEYAC